MLNQEEVRAALTGPFASIHVPFNRDGGVDYDGLRSELDCDLDAGSKTIMLTAGDSHYICLGDEEIAEVTRVTCEHVAGRAMVIAADRYHATRRARAFAEFAKETGADVVMCMPCDWGPSATPETLADHYASVAEVMPVMIVTNVFLGRSIEFGMEAIQRALDKSPNVMAVKDDVCGRFAQELSLRFEERCPTVAGGQKIHHLNMFPFGCNGYMSTFVHFYPEISRRYWSAIMEKDMKTACRITRDYDVPYFDYIMQLPGGWNAGLHATLELYGIAKRWRRPPYYSLNDEEMEQLAGFLRDLGIL